MAYLFQIILVTLKFRTFLSLPKEVKISQTLFIVHVIILFFYWLEIILLLHLFEFPLLFLLNKFLHVLLGLLSSMGMLSLIFQL